MNLNVSISLYKPDQKGHSNCNLHNDFQITNANKSSGANLNYKAGNCELKKNTYLPAPQNESTFSTSPQTQNTSNEGDTWANNLLNEFRTLLTTFSEGLTNILTSIFGTRPSNSSITLENPTPPPPSTSTPTEAPTSNTNPSNPNISNPTPGTLQFAKYMEFSVGDRISGFISEQTVRECMIGFQIYQQDVEAEKIYKDSINEAKAQGHCSDHSIKIALKKVEDSGRMTREDSNWYYSLTHNAAQLDQNKEILSFGREMNTEAAIRLAEQNLILIATGAVIPNLKTID